jgi:hypothetical protein
LKGERLEREAAVTVVAKDDVGEVYMRRDGAGTLPSERYPEG